MASKKSENLQTVVRNRKAYHLYTILEKIEAGIELKGVEVKAIREARITLHEAFVRIDCDEAYLYNAHISPYSAASTHEFWDTLRRRKLLLHKSEIKKLSGQVTLKGNTIVPLSMYFQRGKIKVEIALCAGKKQYDKREAVKKKDFYREAARILRNRQRK